MSAKHVLVCWECGRPGRITEDNQTYCEHCGPGVEAVPDEETAYGNDCRGGSWMRWWRRRMEDGMIGLVYEYQCREHGTSNPIVIFRNLRYLHLCPKCKREMKKVYVKTVTGGTDHERD